MKRQTMTMWGLGASLVFGLPLVGIAEEPTGTKSSLVADAKDAQAQAGQATKTIVYQPPRKGAPAPGLRRGGGTRGMNKSVPVISLLAPEHVGLTLQEQPVLYWFTPTKQDRPFSFEFHFDRRERRDSLNRNETSASGACRPSADQAVGLQSEVDDGRPVSLVRLVNCRRRGALR